MALPVVAGASILCTMGLSPGALAAVRPVFMGGAPCLTIQDCAPLTNVGPCGLCTAPANPAVASATAAALGVLTPMPCVPAPLGVWACPPAPLICGLPGLTGEGTLVCSHGGAIRVLNPGQAAVSY